MENKLYTDNLETFLRDSIEDFKMYPSKKVWNSLYNSMHPAKRWPSMAVLLFLISAIMFVGVSNTTKISKRADIQLNSSYPFIANIPLDYSNYESEGESNIAKQFSTENKVQINTIAVNSIASVNKENNIFNGVRNKNLYAFHDDNKLNSNYRLDLKNSQPNKLLVSNSLQSEDLIEEIESDKNEKKINDFVEQLNDGQKSKLAFEFYATPSIGYRIYSTNNDAITDMSRFSYNGAQNENPLNHSSSLNLEAGGNVLFSLTDNMRIKAGLQLNYTNYNISAYQLTNSSLTTVLMNDMIKNQPALSTRFSNISNIPQSGNQINLNNNTFQVSLPLGADFKLAGNSLIQWYAGATVQPTFVAGGNAYLISSETNNYVNEGSAIRSFNINGGLETFISYKLKDGFILNAGPQLRYQFLSTYSDKYMLNEKLYNLGVKLGVTTNF